MHIASSHIPSRVFPLPQPCQAVSAELLPVSLRAQEEEDEGRDGFCTLFWLFLLALSNENASQILGREPSLKCHASWQEDVVRLLMANTKFVRGSAGHHTETHPHRDTSDTGHTITNTQSSTAMQNTQAQRKTHRGGAMNTQTHRHTHRDMDTWYSYTPQEKSKHT